MIYPLPTPIHFSLLSIDTGVLETVVSFLGVLANVVAPLVASLVEILSDEFGTLVEMAKVIFIWS